MSWKIDQAHTNINFSAKHMMISKVKGRFEKFEATIDGDENNPLQAKVDIKIDAASVNTNQEQRDGHLKSPDFFDVAKYPYLTFKSKRAEQKDATHGKLIGDLTIKDVTREVALDVEFLGQAQMWGKTSAGFTAKTVINRKDWGLAWNQVIESGGLLVSDEIAIEVEAELVKN